MSRIYINDDWQFTEKFTCKLNSSEYSSDLITVSLPHTCKETDFHYFDENSYQMVSGYRKNIFIPLEWENKSISLTFEGVGHVATVYFNGEEIGRHNCGYTAFSLDLTEKVLAGQENLLVVSCDSRETSNVPPFGYVIDYMTYGGIYRDVYLEVREKKHIQDAFLKSEFDGLKPRLISEISLSGETSGLKIMQSVVSLDGNVIYGSAEKVISDEIFTLRTELENVKLWDINSPALYRVKTQLVEENQIIDEREDLFGFRKAEFKTDGFYLNEKKLKLRGLNRHQSYPYVGYAMPESMQRHDAQILKRELGCNAVRTSHYPQSHYFIEECDKLGLLVFMEIPGWQHIGDADWKNQAVENVKEMVTQYRNHTSIILWGVRINESKDDDEFYKRTNQVAHQLDDSRPTGGVRAHVKSHLFEDVYTYNDFSCDGNHGGCLPKKAVTSDKKKPYLISEYNGHMYPTKTMDWEEHRLEHALRHARVLNDVKGQEDIAGSFGWCMFDYNTHKDFGSGDRICYHGVMDMFRNPKLAALVYACESEEEDVLELTSSMDIGEHPGCNRGFTYILSNADSVRMYKNAVFIKEYSQKDSPFHNLKHGPMLLDDFIGDEIKNHENFKPNQEKAVKFLMNYTALHGFGKFPPKLVWNALKCMVCYHMNPGDAVAYYNKYIGDWGGTSTVYRFDAIKDGKVVKSIVKKPMTSWHLETKLSSSTLKENHSYDVTELRIQACDENGNLLPFVQESLAISTEGPVELIGPSLVPLRGGMAGCYIKSRGESGKAKVKLQVLNQEPVCINLEVLSRV